MHNPMIKKKKPKFNAHLTLREWKTEKSEHTWTSTSPLHIHHHCCYPGFARILSTGSQLSGIPGSQLHPGMPV
jgi:hypothetical protein